MAGQLCEAVSVATAVDPSLHVTVSIGVAPIAAGQAFDTALAHADLALYAAKGAGRNRAQLFCEAHYRAAAQRVSLFQRVGAALEEGTMRLFAQPIVDLRTGEAVRHELLIRLRDPQAPPLSPADFLPAAERTDLVLELDRWVLQRAVRARPPVARRRRGCGSRSTSRPVRWRTRISGDGSSNSSRRPRCPGATRPRDHRDHGDQEPRRRPPARDPADRGGLRLRARRLGAGYGSFSYLKYLPFTTVKIAGEFVGRPTTTLSTARSCPRSSVWPTSSGCARSPEQVDWPTLVTHLSTLGVDDGQGFHLGRPQPLDALLDEL